MKKLFHVPVRQLVEQTLRYGDLTLDVWSPNRSIDGIRGHQRVQQSRPEEYSKEVTLTHHVETSDFILEVSGRVDGIYRYPGKVVIDEIKTTTGNLDRLIQEDNPIHWGQAKVYAYIYALQNELDQVTVQLTYYHIDTTETREAVSHFLLPELEQFFSEIVGRYLDWLKRIETWRQERGRSLESLQFPYPSYRTGQRRMAVEVFRTIKEGGQLTVEAPTGIGKTMAAVFPTLKAMAEDHADMILYLTARTTGKAVAEASLRTLREKGLRLKSVTLTAKDKICFNPEKACNGEECAYARGYYDRLGGAMNELFERDDFNRDAVEETANRHRVCPFELSLELCLWADVVIGDYNYAFDPGVYLRRLLDDDGARRVFLVDEAHNLVDRGREMFSAEIRKQPMLALRRQVKERQNTIYKSLGRTNAWLAKCRKRCELNGGEMTDPAPPEELFPLLRGFCRATEKWLLATGDVPGPLRDAILDIYFDLSRFLRVSERYDETYSTCYKRVGADLRLKLYCKDPSKQLNAALKRSRAAVFYSATMTPTDYFQNIFGCEETVRGLALPSPFPKEHLRLVVSDHISTLYRKREETKEALTQALVEFVRQRKGNYMLYFPSYEYLTSVHALFTAEWPDVDVLIQTPEMTETERDQFLRNFAYDSPESLVGFAVMGGVFGEGIDLVGDRLTGAAVVGVGLPGISPERELIREFFDQQGTGFEYAYLYPGINRVLQAAGRVIRSETDKGVVLLIDPRFTRSPYRSLLPSFWQPLRVNSEDQLRKTLAGFWTD